MSTYSLHIGPASLSMGHTEALPHKMRPLVWEITNVFVPEEHRNKGWGSKLIQHACETADIQKMLLVLHVEEGNEHLIDWYGKFGFQTIQQEPEILMARSVQPVLHKVH
jgi:ribosomal protein S18 acetylase RimI-like enzyme